jgi:hypothetical protein
MLAEGYTADPQRDLHVLSLELSDEEGEEGGNGGLSYRVADTPSRPLRPVLRRL